MYEKEIIVPEGVSIEIEGRKIKVSGPKGSLEKEFKGFSEIRIEKSENKIRIFSESERRKIKAMVGTIEAHIKNMIKGVTKGFVYKLRVVYSHFPVNLKIEEDKILIQNFLGERVPRVAKRVKGVDIKVEGQDIIVSGINIEDVGLMASRLEQSTRIKGYDRRVFSDGIYIVSRE
ncbi:MAG: 50S ribosomal protein L6 [Candidatus Aenigmatarchaeota archaeon]